MFVTILSDFRYKYYTVHEYMYTNVCNISFSFINIIVVPMLKKNLRIDQAYVLKCFAKCSNMLI